MSCSLEMKGMDDLIKRFEEMGKKSTSVMNEALIEGSQPVLDEMKSTNAFKDRTGRLRESLKISKVRTSKGGKLIWVGDVDASCGYSWYVEYGHSKAAARPFIRPAWNKRKNEAQKRIIEAVKRGIMK